MNKFRNFFNEGKTDELFREQKSLITDVLKDFNSVSINRISYVGNTVEIEVQSTFNNKKSAVEGLNDIEKILKSDLGAVKLNNPDWNNKHTMVQSEWKTNKTDDISKPWEAFISMEYSI